jgi:anti-sigma factor RsiW
VECHEAQDVIHAYFDGELDLVRTLDFERHIQECQACSQGHESLAKTRRSIHSAGLYFKAPPGLEQRIALDIRKAGGQAPALPISIARRWMAVAASLALVAITTWAIVTRPGASAENLLALEVRSSHVRSMMGTHLLDVQSADQHTVKPWFDGRLDFAPQVRDFKADSFPLLGGRLDYLAERPVAALVYGHEKHLINLFIWPAKNKADGPVLESVDKGYSMVHWTREGMNYWAISDMSNQVLRHFADLCRDQK